MGATSVVRSIECSSVRSIECSRPVIKRGDFAEV